MFFFVGSGSQRSPLNLKELKPIQLKNFLYFTKLWNNLFIGKMWLRGTKKNLLNKIVKRIFNKLMNQFFIPLLEKGESLADPYYSAVKPAFLLKK